MCIRDSAAAVPAFAQDAKLTDRMESAANVIEDVMNTPDKGIPQSILANAKCVVVIPSYKKGAFVVGAQYGQGVATCRTPRGWSAPAFVQLTGGSFGWQIGGQSTDLVLVAMNQRGLEDMLKDCLLYTSKAGTAAAKTAKTQILSKSFFIQVLHHSGGCGVYSYPLTAS